VEDRSEALTPWTSDLAFFPAPKRRCGTVDFSRQPEVSMPSQPSVTKRDHFARVQKLAMQFAGVEVGTSYGTPALRVRKKFLCRMKEDGETLALTVGSLEEKEFLMAEHPTLFFETDHYKGWPVFLIRLNKISDRRLSQLLAEAWRRAANKKLLEAQSEKALLPAKAPAPSRRTRGTHGTRKHRPRRS
jgi:hypothetical protein